MRGAALGGAIAFYKNLGRELKTAVEIVRPMQTIVLAGVRGPKDPVAIFGLADRDTLYRNGISALVINADGSVALDRVVTTYRSNPAGLPDTTFLDIEEVFASVYCKRHFKTRLVGTYPRHALREDNPNNIQGVATPTQLRSCIVHAATELNVAGVLRQLALFVANLIVDADYDNDRANFYLPVAVTAQLRVFAVNETIFTNLTEAKRLRPLTRPRRALGARGRPPLTSNRSTGHGHQGWSLHDRHRRPPVLGSWRGKIRPARAVNGNGVNWDGSAYSMVAPKLASIELSFDRGRDSRGTRPCCSKSPT